MAIPHRIDAFSYYDFLPAPQHECGDVWRGLTSFGMLGPHPISGIIITPACDLSWDKSETATYLPIVPIRSYFSLDAALPLIVPRLLNLLTNVPKAPVPKWQTDGFFPPSLEDVRACMLAVEDVGVSRQLGQKTAAARDAALAGLAILSSICQPGLEPLPSATLAAFYGQGWLAQKQRIITNAFSPALHFLPADAQNVEFSAVREHSLVLLRYPITIPVRVLSMAQETAPTNWTVGIDNSNLSPALKEALRYVHPMKILSLKSAFLSDLLTRYSALYNRLGSPDFSSETVARYSDELDNL